MNVLQALRAAIRCTPIPPRKKRKRSGDNNAAAGTGTGRRGNGAAETRNISGLRGTSNTLLIDSNISTRSDRSRQQPTSITGKCRGDGSVSRNDLHDIKTTSKSQNSVNKKSVSFRDGVTDDKDQRRHTISDSESIARASRNIASTVSLRSTIDEVEQEEKTEIEGTMKNAVYEEVGMFEAIQCTPMEGGEVEGNDDAMDEETGLFKDKA